MSSISFLIFSLEAQRGKKEQLFRGVKITLIVIFALTIQTSRSLIFKSPATVLWGTTFKYLVISMLEEKFLGMLVLLNM